MYDKHYLTKIANKKNQLFSVTLFVMKGRITPKKSRTIFRANWYSYIKTNFIMALFKKIFKSDFFLNFVYLQNFISIFNSKDDTASFIKSPSPAGGPGLECA